MTEYQQTPDHDLVEYVRRSLYSPQFSILAGNTEESPEAITLSESNPFIGFYDGEIKALSVADMLAILELDLTITLDDAYNASAGASTVNVDAGNLTWDISGGYDFIIDIDTGVVEREHGFIVRDSAGTDYFKLLIPTPPASLYLLAALQSADFNTASGFGVIAGGPLSLSGFSVSLTGTNEGITLTSAAHQLLIRTTTSGTLSLTSAALLDIDAAANIDIDVTGSFDMLATTTFSIDGTGASNVSATAGNLTLSTITTGSLLLQTSAAGNYGIGTSSFATSELGFIAMASGTKPTAAWPADVAHIGVADRGGTAGKASVHMYCEDGTGHVFGDYCGFGTVAPTCRFDFVSADPGYVMRVAQPGNGGIQLSRTGTDPGSAYWQVFNNGGCIFDAGGDVYFRANGNQSFLCNAGTGYLAISAGASAFSPSSFVDIQQAGTVTADINFLELTNIANNAAMTNTRTSILWNQWYYDGATPAVADAAKITVGTEGNWTSTASTQDAYMAFHTVLDGTMTEQLRVSSAGVVSGASLAFDDQWLSAAITLSQNGTTGLVGFVATSIVGGMNEVMSGLLAHASRHNAGGADALAIDAVAGTGSLRTLGTGATSACAGNDARLSDARTPTAHASSHNAGGGDALAIDAAAGTGSLRTLGTGALTACAGNDSRLSDARTPTSHASSHQSGGGDAIKLDDLSLPDDNTDLDASTSRHGLLLKATAPAANELSVVGITNGETAYTNKDLFNTTTPAQVGTGAAGTAIQASRSDHVHGSPKLDDCAAPDDNTDLNASTTAHGLLKKLSNVSTEFMNGQGAWATPAGAARPYAEMYMNANSTALTNETANTPILSRLWTTGTLSGWTFVAGTTGAITAYSNYGGTVPGTVRATSAAHGLVTGDVISIRGTTNYNGVFVVTRIDATYFYFTDTWVADDGASDWDKGAYLLAGASAEGVYKATWTLSLNVTVFQSSNVIPQLYVNATACNKCRGKEFVGTSDECNDLSGQSFLTIAAGDKVFLAVTCSNANANPVLQYGSVILTIA